MVVRDVSEAWRPEPKIERRGWGADDWCAAMLVVHDKIGCSHASQPGQPGDWSLTRAMRLQAEIGLMSMKVSRRIGGHARFCTPWWMTGLLVRLCYVPALALEEQAEATLASLTG